jgi:hypothetical protein
MTEKTKMDKIVNANSPTSYTDGFNLAVDKDGMVLMQFVSVTPDAVIENHRTIMSKTKVTKLIDSLCSIVDHYPKKPIEIKKTK